MKGRLPHRGEDAWGSGAFGASRGSRTHSGQDYAAWPGTTVECWVAGTVTTLGYTYATGTGGIDEADSYRYVEVTAADGHRFRYHYVSPSVKVGDELAEGDPLGQLQDIALRYPDITPHVHLEVYDQDGGLIDPRALEA